MRAYIDTNVLIDFACRRVPFYDDAKRLFASGFLGRVQLLTSALSFVNAMYIARKYGYEEVTECLLKVSDFVEIVDLKGSVVVNALSAGWKDYEDATQCMSATHVMADCIVTRNIKDFKNAPLPVYTVDEVLVLL